MLYKGQAEQDKFVLNILKGKHNGFFLEIGSNHPINTNNTYILETVFNWKGIMIEYDDTWLNDYKNLRKNSKHLIIDCIYIDYKELLKDSPRNIDYLQIDVEVNNGSTIKILEKLDTEIMHSHKFATVTFKHNYYNSGEYKYTREKSRNIFEKRGYVNVFYDINDNDPNKVYEDWWVHPDLVDMEYIKELKQCNVINYKKNYLVNETINWKDIIYPNDIFQDVIIINNPIIDNINMLWIENEFTENNYPNPFHQHEQKKESLKYIIEKNQNVIDVGAHIGDYGLCLAHALSNIKMNNIIVYCIDPSIEKCNFMKKIKDLNNLENIKIICKGLTDKDNIKYNVNDGIIEVGKNTGGWQWIEDKNGLSFTTLDNLYSQGLIDNIGFMWLDAQWNEDKILKGGLNTLQKFKPYIFMEYDIPTLYNKDNVSVEKTRKGSPNELKEDVKFKDILLTLDYDVKEIGMFYDLFLFPKDSLNNPFIYIGPSHFEQIKIIELDKIYPPNTKLKFIHDFKDTYNYKFYNNKLIITRTDENCGWGQDLIGYLVNTN